MEKDIVPELYENISADIKKQLNDDKKIYEMYRLIADEKADYKTANEFSERVGEIYSAALKNNINSGVLPDGKMYYNIAERTVHPALEDCYETVANASTQIQQILNKSADIGIKAIKPELNSEKVSGFINKLSNSENFDDVSWMLGEPVINFAQSVVDDTVKINADFHYRAGLSPKITRIVSGKCCDWCNELAGTYNYGEEPKDIYRRHEYCHCQVLYDPGTGKVQNAHTKKWINPDNQDLIEQRRKIGLRDNEGLLKKYPINPLTGERYLDHEMITTDKQFGKKIGKHAEEWGLDASFAADREKMKAIIDDIRNNADERVYGEWKKQNYPVVFHIKGDDVIVESENNEFITVLKGGINNGRVQAARK